MDEMNKTERKPSTKILENNKKEENVLFFTLSTLGRTLSMNKYYGICKDVNDEEKSVNYTGISQLEPGTKQVLYDLALKGEKLDRIVLVESIKTRTEHREEISDLFWDDPEEMKSYYTSAVCFYKQRIRDYLRRKENKEVFKNVQETYFEENRNHETPFIDTVEYTEEELDALFYDIPTYEINEKPDEEDLTYTCYEDQSLALFNEIIYGIRGNSNKRINLYIDTQGGSRSAMSQTDAVLELLKDQNVNIKGRYAIKNFDPKDKEKVYEVRQVDDEYKAYELVSAMTEFKRYGRGQGLVEFFAKDTNPETQEIVQVIKKISGAIALCNIDEFQKQIKKLAEINRKMKEKKLNSQISIVFNDIIDDYETLLSEESTTFDIVKWCVKKSFYQQALTLIESLMPEMLVECGYLKYNPMDYVNMDNEKKTIASVCKVVNKLNWKKDVNYLFEMWVRSNCEQEKNKAKVYFGVSESVIKKLSVESDLKKESSKLIESKPVSIEYEKGKQVAYHAYSQNLENDPNRNMFCMFAALSNTLKELRNRINHATVGKMKQLNRTGESMEEYVRRLLDVYLRLGEQLSLNERWIEFQNTRQSAQYESGTIVDFWIEKRGGKKGQNLSGLVNGAYEGTIEKNYLEGLSDAQLNAMCGTTVRAKVNRINGGRYLLIYEPKISDTEKKRTGYNRMF